jgi:peroxiredoxin
MPNSLTGACAAVVQVSVKWINGLLATIHQNGADRAVSPSFPHSETLQVGQPSASLDPGIKNFNDWLVLQDSVYPLTPGTGGQWTVDFDRAPPGVVGTLKESAIKWNSALVELITEQQVSGRAQIQFSTPAISFNNRLPIVYSRVFVRAHYFAAHGSHPLPAPIHGEVKVNYAYGIENGPAGKFLNVPIPTSDSDIQFAPEPGTVDAAGDQELTQQIRIALRKSFQPMRVPLPAEFPFAEFKAVGASSDQALALAVELPGMSPPPAGGLAGVTDHFLQGASFGIAVSADAIRLKFEPILQNLRQFTTKFTVETPVSGIPVIGDALSPEYTFSVTSVVLNFVPGALELVINGQALTNHPIAPNYPGIVIKQRITIALQGQDVVLQASDGDLILWGFPSVAVSTARTEIINQRNAALPSASDGVRDGFRQGLQKLNQGIQQFDKPSAAHYDSTELTPEGLIVRGSIVNPVPRRPPIVSVRWTEGFEGKHPNFTAFESWFPGGRITNYEWALFEIVRIVTPEGYIAEIPWKGKYRSFPDDPHRFIFRHPSQVHTFTRACLTIDGEQTLPTGDKLTGLSAYGATGSCRPSRSEPVVVLPPGFKNPLIPIWYPPDIWTPESIMTAAVVGHVSASTPRPIERGVNHVLHFADWNADQPLANLHRCLSHVARRGHSFMAYVVVPAGALQLRRGEFEKKLGIADGRVLEASDERNPPVQLQVVEDLNGAWAEMFAPRGRSTTMLINARGEYVWQREGEIHPGEFGGILEEHALDAPQPQGRMLDLNVRPGQPALDVNVVDVTGRTIALRRLRGRNVLLTFWQSGLQPCVDELCRLQELVDRAEQRAPFVLAICGDATDEAVGDVRDEHRLTYPLAHDPYQRLAHAFGVDCWPTTIGINADGIVNHIQFGTMTKRPRD